MKNPSGYKKEQIMGVEPTPSAWEADVLPIYYICTILLFYNKGINRSYYLFYLFIGFQNP